MNLPVSVPERMNYIQNLFLSVQDYMQTEREFEELIKFLEAEPAEFRSIAYESASMQMALQELSLNPKLENWKIFYDYSSAHSFHMEIGLGWAFAKNEVSPTPFFELLHPVSKQMVFDGIGYYYALYKGRKTVKSQILPDNMDIPDTKAFDQGVGRRLWYICKGEVHELIALMVKFDQKRHGDLFRGVGIACGYVGGCNQIKLEQLLKFAGKFQKQLSEGVSLSALSRKNSNSINNDIALACNVICGKPLHDVVNEIGAKEVFLNREF